MSGGVDSSVAAALLVDQGYEVIGIMLRLWSEPGGDGTNRCCSPDAMANARRVAAMLGIPFYAIDAQERFRNVVVQTFMDGYAQGITPNPCLNCNRWMRWGFLMQHARAFGADFLSTGHYARLRTTPSGAVVLLQAVDQQKDQSYVLSVLNQEQLVHSLFPLGEYSKPQVRQLARDFGLPVAEREESQDLCFIADGNYRRFLQEHNPQVSRPGPILDHHGQQRGEHQGLAFFTIGQRKGLGISSPDPLYVLEKRTADNALVVGPSTSLGHRGLLAGDASWVSGEASPEPFRARVKIRYRAEFAEGLVTPLDNHQFEVEFDRPVRDITPGQGAVVYLEEVCLGSGIIRGALGSALPSALTV